MYRSCDKIISILSSCDVNQWTCYIHHGLIGIAKLGYIHNYTFFSSYWTDKRCVEELQSDFRVFANVSQTKPWHLTSCIIIIIRKMIILCSVDHAMCCCCCEQLAWAKKNLKKCWITFYLSIYFSIEVTILWQNLLQLFWYIMLENRSSD